MCEAEWQRVLRRRYKKQIRADKHPCSRKTMRKNRDVITLGIIKQYIVPAVYIQLFPYSTSLRLLLSLFVLSFPLSPSLIFSSLTRTLPPLSRTHYLIIPSINNHLDLLTSVFGCLHCRAFGVVYVWLFHSKLAEIEFFYPHSFSLAPVISISDFWADWVGNRCFSYLSLDFPTYACRNTTNSICSNAFKHFIGDAYAVDIVYYIEFNLLCWELCLERRTTASYRGEQMKSGKKEWERQKEGKGKRERERNGVYIVCKVDDTEINTKDHYSRKIFIIIAEDVICTFQATVEICVGKVQRTKVFLPQFAVFKRI